MKFKVGDKVRVKKNLVIGEKYGTLTYFAFLHEEKHEQEIQVITRITSEGNYRLNKSHYIYSEGMLELVEEHPEKLVIYRENDKVIAKYYKGDKTVTAEVKCVPEDDFGHGAKLVMDRAIEKMKEEEIGYSWVRCVGYRQKDEFAFTVGKEYKIYNNGEITCDDGYTFVSEYTKEDMLHFLSKWYIFEEVNS